MKIGINISRSHIDVCVAAMNVAEKIKTDKIPKTTSIATALSPVVSSGLRMAKAWRHFFDFSPCSRPVALRMKVHSLPLKVQMPMSKATIPAMAVIQAVMLGVIMVAASFSGIPDLT